MAMRMIRTAILLAAGAGTKFWPYNVVRQKAAFPIANVPAVRRLADDLTDIGITRLIVVVGAGEASVRAALRGCKGDVAFVRQSDLAGTAPAVLAGVHGVDEDVLVVAGDIICEADNFSALLHRFEAEGPLAAALIQPLGKEAAQNWLVAYPEGDVLRGIEGHSRDGEYRLCGVYALRADALPYLADNPGVMSRVPVGGMPPVEAEIAQSLQMMLDEGLDVLAVETSGYYVDLDKPWHVLEANYRVIHAMGGNVEENVIPASSRIHDGAEIHGRVVLGKNCTVGNRVVLRGNVWLADGASVVNGAIIDGPAVIGKGTIIRDYCQIGGHTTVGARGIYGHGAEFSGVALDTVYCYHYCEIWGVVGQAVDFGAATVCGNLRFDDGDTVWRVRNRPERPDARCQRSLFWRLLSHRRQRDHHAGPAHRCLQLRWRGRCGI